MKASDIIRADWEKHYSDRGIPVEELLEGFQKYCQEGKAYFTTDKVLTLLKYVGHDTVEFHCMNGGDGRDLTQAVNLLCNKLSDRYERAVTYFDNPRISEFVKYSDFRAKVEEINHGPDMKYELTIFIGENHGRNKPDHG